MRFCSLLLAGLVGLLSACLDTFEPEVGPLTNVLCIDDDSDPNASVSLANDIVPLIFDPETTGCLQCHAPSAATPFGFEVSGLDLSNYRALRAGGARSGTNIVVPGRPCESLIFLKTLAGPPVGGRMPLSGGPFLSETQTQLLHDWIAEGARNN